MIQLSELTTYWTIRSKCEYLDVPFEFVYTSLHTLAAEMLKTHFNLYSDSVILAIFTNYASCVLPSIKLRLQGADEEIDDETAKSLSGTDFFSQSLAAISYDEPIKVSHYQAAEMAYKAMMQTVEKCGKKPFVELLADSFKDEIKSIQSRL